MFDNTNTAAPLDTVKLNEFTRAAVRTLRGAWRLPFIRLDIEEGSDSGLHYTGSYYTTAGDYTVAYCRRHALRAAFPRADGITGHPDPESDHPSRIVIDPELLELEDEDMKELTPGYYEALRDLMDQSPGMGPATADTLLAAHMVNTHQDAADAARDITEQSSFSMDPVADAVRDFTEAHDIADAVRGYLDAEQIARDAYQDATVYELRPDLFYIVHH